MRYVMIAFVAMLALAGCGGGTDDVPGAQPDTVVEPGPGAGAPADGGLSIADAKASDLEGPLMVGGYIVAEDQVVRLCDTLMESFPPQCGGESLLVEGLDLDAYETRSEGGVRWTDAPVPVLGDVEGETLRVRDTAA